MLKHFKKLKVNTINKFLVGILLLIIPLYPKFPLLSIPGSQVAIRLEDFVLFGVMAIWAVANRYRMKEILTSRIAVAVLLFLTVSLLSVLSGVFVTQTVSLSVGLFHWLRRIEYIAPVFLGLTAVNSKSDIRFYIKLFTVVIMFVFVYGVGQKYFNWPIITTQNQEYAKGVALFYVPGSHLVSTFAGHYDMASVLILISPIFYLLLFGKKISLSKKILFTSVILMSLWLLVNAASRISVAAYLGSVSIALFLARKYKWIPMVVITIVLFTITSSKIMDRYVQLFQVYIEKALSTNVVLIDHVYAQEIASLETTPVQPVVEDRSTSIRLNVEWPRALRAFEKNPLLGTGFSSITLATDNDYLRMIGEVGLLGFLSFFLIIGRVMQQLIKAIPFGKKISIKDMFIITTASAFPGIMLNMVFIDILEASKFAIIFWLIVGLSISTIQTSYDR